MIVLIPARLESAAIGHTIDLLLDQTSSSGARFEKFEAVVLNNVRDGESFDETRTIVEQLCISKGASSRVHVIDLVVPKDISLVNGWATGLMADSMVRRVLDSDVFNAPLYLVHLDADIVWIDKSYLWRHMSALDARPDLDAVCPRNCYAPWLLADHDLCLFSDLLWHPVEFTLSLGRYRPDRNLNYDMAWNRIRTAGCNTIAKLETYCMTCGWNENVFAADMSFGERVSVVRGSSVSGRFVPQTWSVARSSMQVHSSPRRWIHSAGDNRAAYDSSGNRFYSKSLDKWLKDRTVTELLAEAASTSRLSASNIDRFEDILSARLGLLTRVRRGGAAGRTDFTEVLAWLGIHIGRDYDIDSSRVTLRSTEAVERALTAARTSLHLDSRIRLSGPHARVRSQDGSTI